MRKGKKKLAQMMAAVLTATTLLQTPVSAFADPLVEERVEKETSEADSEIKQEPENEKEAEKPETSENEKAEDSKEDAGEDSSQDEDGESDADADDSEDESKEDTNDGKEEDDSDKEETEKDSEQDKKEDSYSVDSKENQDTTEKEDAKIDADEAEEPEEEPEKKPGILDKILDALFPKKEIPEEEIEEVEATPSILKKTEDLIFFNTGNLEIGVAAPEDFEEEGIGDDCFDEDGSYTIEIPEENPFFPYEVQFTVDGKKRTEWFMDPDDSVRVDGHKFFVSAYFDDTVVTQMSLDVAGETVIVYPEEKKFTNDQDSAVAPLSLLPLKEINLRVNLSKFTPLELTSVSLDNILTGTMSDVTEIVWEPESSESKKIIWKAGGVENTVNMSSVYDSWEMIVGEADQLASENIRYFVEIEAKSDEDWLIPTLYCQDENGNRQKCDIKEASYELDGFEYIELNGEDQDFYYLGLELNKNEFPNSTEEFDVWNEDGEKITDKLFSQNMDEKDAGYRIEDGETLIFRLRSVQTEIKSHELEVEFLIYGNRKEVFNSITNDIYKLSGQSANWNHSDMTGEWDDAVNGRVEKFAYDWSKNNLPEDMYKLVLFYEVKENADKITAAYVGYYSSMEDARKAGAFDIKEQIFDKNQGLNIPFGQNTYVTVFEGSDTNPDRYIHRYCFALDWWLSSSTYVVFHGLKDSDGNSIPCNLVTGGNDNYGDNGYVTIEVGAETDLTKLAPVFSVGQGAKLYAGNQEEISGVSQHDFSQGAVAYTVAAENGEDSKNYWLQVVKTGFQYGPLYINSLTDADAHTHVENGVVYSDREMLLDGRYGYEHEILLLNMGTEDIPNLSVELNSEQVELDWYWTLKGNHSLAGFKGTKANNTENQAKLRFKAKEGTQAGEKISGTLTIKSGDTTMMVLNLTGLIGDPCIVTKTIPNAVKYVHYGVMVQNNNRYSFNKVTYSQTGGSLPTGMILKSNGEIYGVPKETGNFTFEVTMKNSYGKFSNSKATFTLIVDDNTDENVENATDAGYTLKERIPDITLSDNKDYTMISIGVFDEWKNVYLDGEELTEVIDYDAESGSTRLTIRNQTLKAHNTVGQHTISAEFREKGSDVLKRASQNYRVLEKGNSNNGNNNNGNNNSNNNNGNSQTNTNTGNRSSSSRDTGSSVGSWSQENGKWRYKNPNGTYAANEWKQLSYNGTMEWYYFGEDGIMMTGWLVLNGKTYYLNPESDGTQGKMCTGWKLIDGIWYFFNDSTDMEQRGVMTTGGWQYLAYNGTTEWYFFNEQGQMQTGWVTDGDKKYYLYPIADGTRGRMLTGWQTIDGKEYYLNEVSDGTKGAMAMSTRIGDRYVDRNGVRVR